MLVRLSLLVKGTHRDRMNMLQLFDVCWLVSVVFTELYDGSLPIECQSIFVTNVFMVDKPILTQGGQGAVSIRKTVLLGMVIPMLKIRRPTGRLIFNMGIPIPGKTVFYIETGPWWCIYASGNFSHQCFYMMVSWLFIAKPLTGQIMNGH